MARNSWRFGAVMCVLACGAAPDNGHAGNVVPEQEYAKYIDKHNAIQGIGATPFGEQINLRDGGIQFRQVDIELPGIGPTIRIARTLKVKELAKLPETTGNGFGGWELEIPRLKTITNSTLGVRSTSPYGWQVPGGNKNARCTNFAGPGDIAFSSDTARHWSPGEWWNGYQLVDDGGDEQQVLRRYSFSPAPSGSSGYVANTSANWVVSCLPTTANGEAGEGFLVLAPDGTKYWLNYLVYTAADTLNKALWSSPPPYLTATGSSGNKGKGKGKGGGGVIQTIADEDYLERRYAAMMVTRIEDRFGNWVTYNYSSGLLNSIEASDGRHVDFSRDANGMVSTIGVGQGSTRRLWTYQRNGGGDLTNVVQPDGSQWTYALSALTTAPPLFEPETKGTGQCTMVADPTTSSVFQGTATGPSGVTETLVFQRRSFGRSYVPKECWGGTSTTAGDGYALRPADWTAYALQSRTFSGPGISNQTWTYDYSSPNASWAQDCANGCPSTVWTDVTAPNGTRTRSIFSNKYDETENLLLREETYATNSGPLVKSIDFTYATFPAGGSTPYPWPAYIGDDLQTRTNQLRSERWAPNRQTTITQDGVSFSSYVNSYDAYARPASVGKWSSLGYGKTDVTEYYDDTTHWVLGQVKRHYNADTNLVDTRNEYDPNTALVLQTYAFEKLKATMAYNANGTLATSKDGNNNTTTFSNWKRGIPQAVQYADGTSVSAIVNDNGWVTAVTDENGYSTGYGYDAMGRVASIVYPNEPTFNYNTKTINFQATAGEWVPPGIQTGQWRRFEAVGNHITITYYDAMWRPVLVLEYDSSNVSGTNRYTKIAYDNKGRKIFQSYPATIVSDVGVRTMYDSLDRATQVQQDSELGTLTTTTEYLNGFQVRTTNPRGYQTTNGYQVYDQPSYEQLAWSAQPENKDVTITRNFFGMPLTIKQADHANSAISVTRSYVYAWDMSLCKTIEPESGSTVYYNDAADNLWWSASGLGLPDTGNCNFTEAQNSGRVVNRSYDARNRLSTLNFPDGKGNQSWSYTPDGLPGQITTYNDPNNGAPVVNAYSYNRRRMLGGESVSQPGWYTWSLGYGYDANASLSAQQYPDSMTVTYSPNALGQPTSVFNTNGQAYASGVSYYPNGAMSQFTYGNGIVHTMTHNARQLPARSTDSGSAVDFVYTYDQNGNTTKINDWAQDGVGSGDAYHIRYMGYDGLDRLKDAGSCSFGGDCWHHFSYNALDNITSWKLAGVKDYANYIYDGTNRLTQINNTVGATVVNLSYDVQGNLATKSGQVYSFDYGNRLRSTNQEWYRYDGLGRRVIKWRSTEPGELSIYSQGGQLMYEDNYRADSRKSTRYVYLSGSLLATREYNFDTGAVATKYHHTDALGSPVAVTNESAQVIDRTAWEPYGAAINKPSYDGVGYTGHMMDGATGLTYMQQRYYDPTIGRFLSVDPIGAYTKKGINFNRYWYASNNPYRFTDPDGRWVCQGSSGDCTKFESALNRVAGAAKSDRLSASEQGRLQRVVDFYGKKGDSHVSVSFGSLNGAGGNASLRKDGGEHVTIDMNQTNRRSEDRTMNVLARVVAHEGEHGANDQSRSSSFASRADRFKEEVAGYTTQAVYQKAANFAESSRDGWTPFGGVSQKNIEGQANWSVQFACGSSNTGSCQ